MKRKLTSHAEGEQNDETSADADGAEVAPRESAEGELERTGSGDAGAATGSETGVLNDNAEQSCRRAGDKGEDDDCNKAVAVWTAGGVALALLGGGAALASHGSDKPIPNAGERAEIPLQPSTRQPLPVTITVLPLTNDNKPELSGTAPAGCAVDVFHGTTKLGSAVADAEGKWRLSPAQALDDGKHTVTAKVEDAAGNKGSKDASMVIDTVAPTVTITVDPLTNDNTPEVRGTAPADAAIDIFEGPTKLGSVTADAAGNWSFTPAQPLADGKHTLTAKVKDDACNEGSKDASVEVDTVAPTVTITVDPLTNDNTPEVRGTAPADSLVELFEGSTKLGSSTADNSGKWSFTPAQPLADGKYTLTAKAKDLAGNESTEDASVEVDTDAPTVTVTVDPLTNDDTPEVRGTAPADSLVELFEGPTKLGSATADNSGNWSFTPTQPLADGKYTLTAKVKDGAGNEGSKDGNVEVDTDAPLVTIAVAPLTKDSTPDVTGTAPANSLVELFEGPTKLGSATADNAGNWSFTPTQPLADGKYTLTAKVKDGAGNEGSKDANVEVDTDAPTVTITVDSLTNDNTPEVRGTAPADAAIDIFEGPTKLGSTTADNAGNWSFTPAQPLADGKYTLTAKVKDGAGNEGSKDANVEVDTDAPTVTITVDSLTNDNTPEVRGTAPADAAIDIFEGLTKLGSTTADNSGNWSFTPTQPLADGKYTLTAKVKDGAGNEGSKDGNVEVDTDAPLVTIAVAPLTKDSTPDVTGTAPANSLVELFEGPTKLGSATADNAGNWSFTPTQPLADGKHTLTAKTVDAAGNDSTTDAAVEVDTEAPVITFDGPVVTADKTPTLSGTAPKGEEVEILDGANRIGSTTASSDGKWSFTFKDDLPIDAYSFTAQAVDEAGNVGSAEGDVTVISQGPSGFDVWAGQSNDSTPPFRGTAPAGSKFNVQITNASTWETQQIGVAQADAQGLWTISPKDPIVDGNYLVQISYSTENGALQPIVATYAVDTVAPVITLNAPSVTDDATPLITGTATGFRTLELVGYGFSAPINIRPDASGNWALEGAWLSDGTYKLSLQAFDGVNNYSHVESTMTIHTAVIPPAAGV